MTHFIDSIIADMYPGDRITVKVRESEIMDNEDDWCSYHIKHDGTGIVWSLNPFFCDAEPISSIYSYIDPDNPYKID